ncbi:hypothetical protein LINPERHAP2_LOCUS22268 [Linum perenne]
MAKTTTTKRIKSTTNNSDDIDRISELPDEIIHKVLHHVSSASPVEAARTAVLSRRLRSVWDYYPSMQYRFKDLPHSTVEKRLENFRKFVEASMKRFSRHRQIRMETLDILLAEKFADYYWSFVKQVLEFVMERRVEEIYISSRVPGEDIHGNFRYNSEGRYRSHLCFVKYFIRAAPHCQTVSITNLDEEHNVTFNDVEASNPTSIDHLKYCTVQSNSKVDKRALLEALFKVCRPNHLTLIHRHKNSERFFQGILSLMQQKGDAHESLMWLNGLKDVKIITRDVDVVIEEEEEEKFMRGYSTCKTQNQLCLELTWG